MTRDSPLVKPEPIRSAKTGGMKHSSSQPNLHSNRPRLPTPNTPKHVSPKSDTSVISPPMNSPISTPAGPQSTGMKRKGGRDTQPLDLSSKRIKSESSTPEHMLRLPGMCN